MNQNHLQRQIEFMKRSLLEQVLLLLTLIALETSSIQPLCFSNFLAIANFVFDSLFSFVTYMMVFNKIADL